MSDTNVLMTISIFKACVSLEVHSAASHISVLKTNKEIANVDFAVNIIETHFS